MDRCWLRGFVSLIAFTVAGAALQGTGFAAEAGALPGIVAERVADIRLAQAESAPGAAPQESDPGAPPQDAVENAVPVEPGSIDALLRMGDELRKLREFMVSVEATREQVMDNGQKVEFGGRTRYFVRRPDRMRVEVETDTGERTFYYDGKTLTLYTPGKGFYASAEAKPTIRATIAWAEQTYGLEVPLADLFDWGTPTAPIDEINEGFLVGPARIAGVLCAHYAFSTDEVDWQIWIETGSRPLPRKVVIIDVTDENLPRYEALITWSTHERFDDKIFSFSPPADAKPIAIAPLAERAGSQN